MLAGQGVQFTSDTDSEVIVHLVSSYYEGDLEQAVKKALLLLRGTYGVLVMHVDQPDVIIGARHGSPLVLGIGENEVLLASDVTAILGHTKQVVYIEDGEVVVVTPEGYETTDIQNNRIKKQIDTIGWELEEIEKGSFAHFMLKEIYEQPQSIMRAMQGRIEHDNATACNGWLVLSA